MELSEAKKVLKKEQEENVKKCQEEIKAVMEKNNCTFEVITVLKNNQISHVMSIIPKGE